MSYVIVEREDEESVLVTLQAESLGVSAQLPLFAPYESEGQSVFATSLVLLSLPPQLFLEFSTAANQFVEEEAARDKRCCSACTCSGG